MEDKRMKKNVGYTRLIFKEKYYPKGGKDERF